ncbi:ATP synthase F1 subunit epsilon [bacterium]|nr:ATP synthase F1 subunit epsilon [bacterium]
MANLFHVEVLTPEKHVLAGEIVHVRAPGTSGDFGVLAFHTPMVAGLRAGRLSIDFADHTEIFAIGGGYFTVENNRVIVLAETCVRKQEIDAAAARKEKQEAQAKLDHAETPGEREFARAQLQRATALLQVAEL